MSDFLKQISLKPTNVTTQEVGQVIGMEDAIALASGLKNVKYGEVVLFPNKTKGMVLDLQDQVVGIIILGDPTKIKRGDKIIATTKQLSIAVNEEILGRHLNPLGIPRDGQSALSKDITEMPLESPAYGVIDRQPVDTPFQTGIKSIDAIVPIGRGQRQLIIGDRQTGKTAVTIDSIINQTDVICVYVSIGQKANTLARNIQKLKDHDAMKHTIIISALATDPASTQYLAPYAGAAVTEYFVKQGKDVLVVYDDLTKHAWAYRALSLLLRRPPGREAYPGDVFYLHSRLLERAVCLSDKMGGGTITALPIIETQQGDVSAYVPTNVISITDGQIYLDIDMFNSGFKPAINVGTSVSRIGGDAQIKITKQVAGKLRLELAQYNDLAAFAQFGSDLDEATQHKLNRGRLMKEILQQKQYSPLPIAIQIVIIYAATKGFLDKIAIGKIQPWMKEIIAILQSSETTLLETIINVGKLTTEIEADLTKVIKNSLPVIV